MGMVTPGWALYSRKIELGLTRKEVCNGICVDVLRTQLADPN